MFSALTAKGHMAKDLIPSTLLPASAHHSDDTIDPHSVVRYAETNLPTNHGPLRCIVYRTNAGVEHIAMVAGDVTNGENIFCRIHSECLTSEVFGSLKCDCKQQLDRALDTIAQQGLGVVLYMREQEGRGIGIGNKIRAYAMQELGHDTVDANRLLGLPDDTRDYTAAANMLKDLGVRSVSLVTNNPLKLAGLDKAGIRVQSRTAHVVAAPKHALAYLQTKRERMGHLIESSEIKVLPAENSHTAAVGTL